jgi:hypothetical protein
MLQMISEIINGGSLADVTRAVVDSVGDNCKAVREGCLPEQAPPGSFNAIFTRSRSVARANSGSP